jgi:hypothetical protein
MRGLFWLNAKGQQAIISRRLPLVGIVSEPLTACAARLHRCTLVPSGRHGSEWILWLISGLGPMAMLERGGDELHDESYY